jgi:hypothetical protein
MTTRNANVSKGWAMEMYIGPAATNSKLVPVNKDNLGELVGFGGHKAQMNALEMISSDANRGYIAGLHVIVDGKETTGLHLLAAKFEEVANQLIWINSVLSRQEKRSEKLITEIVNGDGKSVLDVIKEAHPWMTMEMDIEIRVIEDPKYRYLPKRNL